MEVKRILTVMAAVCGLILLLCAGLIGYSVFNKNNTDNGEAVETEKKSEWILLCQIQKNVYYESSGGRLIPTEREDADTYVVCLEDQAARPDKVSYSYSSDQDHTVIYTDQEGNVIQEKTAGRGTFEDQVPEETYMIGFSVFPEDDHFSVRGDGGYEPPETSVTGKYFSVLGDSVSAYEGYTTTAELSFYHPSELNVRDMWWAVLADTTGMVPCRINAIGGAGVTELLNTGYPTAGNSERCGQLDSGGITPDVIFVLLGGNDMIQGVDKELFYDSYVEMLERIKDTYPESGIYVCTYYELPGLYAEGEREVNELIRQAASEAGITYIDSEKCSIEAEEPEEYFQDYREDINTGVHVNQKGQRMFGEYIAESFLKAQEEKTEEGD